MKCPKCGYLGFETSDRCRNCGYDFSLASAAEAPPELPLRTADSAEASLADFEFGNPRAASQQAAGAVQEHVPARHRAASVAHDDDDALPLFAREDGDPGPAITPPRARKPLSVRRTTPEIPRGRSRLTPPARPSEPEFLVSEAPALADEPPVQPDPARTASPELRSASRGARVLAALVDGLLLGLVDVLVVYLTLALAGLRSDAVMRLPLLPLAGFFLILNGGYLIAFVAASGQTIGKMIAGLRVIRDDGHRVDVNGAVLRAAGCVLSLLTAGLGYLPAFVTADGRALQDRMSGTRVVSAR